MMHNNFSNMVYLFVMLAVLFSVPTVFFDRFEEVGPELLQDQKMIGAPAWDIHKTVDSRVEFSNGVLQIHVPSGENSVSVFQSIPYTGGKKIFRLQGIVACSNVIAGKESWNNARLLLVQYREGKPLWNQSHVLLSLDGTQPWAHYKKHFILASNIDQLRIVVQMSRSSGTILVKGLSLYQVHQAFWYNWVQKFAWIAWTSFLLFLAWSYIRQSSNYLIVLLFIASALMIFIGVTVTDQTKNRWKKRVEQSIHFSRPVFVEIQDDKVVQEDIQLQRDKNGSIDTTKVGHFLIFAVLGCLMALLRPNHLWPVLLRDLLLFASATEMLQLYIEGRSTLIGDVFIDTGGGLFGIFLLHMIGQSLRHHASGEG